MRATVGCSSRCVLNSLCSIAGNALTALQALLFREAFWGLDLSRFPAGLHPGQTPRAVAAGTDRPGAVGLVGGGRGVAEIGRADGFVRVGG